MAKEFYYRARSKTGEAVRGSIEANDVAEATVRLTELNLIPIEVGESIAFSITKTFIDPINDYFNRVPHADLLFFTQQLQLIFSVGVPLLKSLKMIQDQSENKKLKEVIDEIMIDVRGGSPLWQALAKHPKVFDKIYVNIVKAGETSGQMEALLDRLYSIIESRIENKNRVKSALFYPKVIIGFMFISVIVMLKVALPRIKGFLSKMGADLPPITQFVFNISDFFTDYFLYIGIISFIGFAAFYKYKSTEKGRYVLDSVLLKFPLVGTLLLEIELYSFGVVLKYLIASGTNLIEALKVTADTCSNSVIRKDILDGADKVTQGTSLYESLKGSKALPQSFLNLISIGEESGKIDTTLEKSNRFYKMNIDYKLANLAKVIEPILLVFIFAGVLVLALAMFLPIWKMSSAVRGR